MPERLLADAQHEAAHVVVGVALGLRLEHAKIYGPHDAETIWAGEPWPREAGLMMWAAGVAWERKHGDLALAAYDLEYLRKARVRGHARLIALERAAWSVLDCRRKLHGRIALQLLERDLTGDDIKRLAGRRRDDF